MAVAAERAPARSQGAPVVDAVLLLLVLLLVAAPLLSRIAGPNAATAPAQELRLQVVRGGTYLLDGRPLSDASLGPALRQAQAQAPDLRLRIATADDDYRGFVGALAVAEHAGVRNIGSEMH